LKVIDMAMPNPSDAEPWIDHTKPSARMGADVFDQQFGFGQVFPLGFGEFEIHFRCENGAFNTTNHLRFTVEFLSNDSIVLSRSHDFPPLHKGSGDGNVVAEFVDRFQLSQEQLSQIKKVRLLGTNLSV
jgi:hypothetical protein